MANWFVRPYGSGISTKNGQSYETAWEGLNTVVWGTGGVQAGDTLWICDTHGYHPSLSHDTSLYAATRLTVGVSGTSEARITIRGDYPGHPGIVYGTNRLYKSGWIDSGVNGVYVHGFKASLVWLYEVVDSDIVPYQFQRYESKNYGNINYKVGNDYIITVDVVNDTITTSSGNWQENQRVVFYQGSGNLPSPLVNCRFYYLKNVSGLTFQVSETPGGSAIDLTTVGGYDIVVYQTPTDSDFSTFDAGDFCLQDYSANGTIVYAKSLSGTSPNSNPTLMAFNDRVIIVTDQSHLIIKNLVIHGRIELRRANYIEIDNVVTRNNTGKACSIFNNSNYITITNCDIENAGDGIYTVSESSYTPNYVIVRNNKIKNILPYWFDGGSEDQHAIAFQGGIGNVAENNYCEYAQRSITHYVGSTYPFGSTCVINNNLVVDSYRTKIGLADKRSSNLPSQKLVDPRMNFVSLGITTGMKVRNRTTGAIGTITAIETTINPNDTLVATLSGGTRQNWQKGDTYQVYNNQAYQHNGDAINSHGPSASSKATVVITNNIIIHSDGLGIRVTSANNRYLTICNNTIYNASIGISISTYSDKLKDIVLKNNIVYGRYNNEAGLYPPYLVYFNSTSGYENTIDVNNNLYYDPNDPEAAGNSFYFNGDKTLATYKASIQAINPNCETATLYADPRFVNSSGSYSEDEDFKLAANSPCRRAGDPTAVSFVTTDYFGNPRYNESGGCCIGAHEMWDTDTLII